MPRASAWRQFFSEGLFILGGAALFCIFFTPYLSPTRPPFSLADYFLPAMVGGLFGGIVEWHRSRLKATAARLSERDARLRSIFAAADNVAFVTADLTDEGARILDFSPGAERIFGYEQRDVLGKPVSLLRTTQDQLQLVEDLEAMRRGGGQYSGQATLVRRSGEEFPALFSRYPLRNAKGEVTAALGVSIDISAQTQAEEEARQYQADLAKSAKLNTLVEMTAGLAHELNQPLTAILMHVEASRLALQSDEVNLGKIREDIGDVAEQARRANKIIHRLRASFQRQEPHFVPVDVNEAIQHIAMFIVSEAGGADVELRWQWGHDLPRVFADPIEIQQVVLNLIKNAIDAMVEAKTDRRLLTIRTAAREAGGVEVTVADTGPGLAGEVADHLFDPFFSTKSTGLGIGLSISRTIVQAHGGRLSFESKLGEGAVFRFTLPKVEGGDRSVA